MRRLILLRHAKAVSPEGFRDYDRPLHARGVAAMSAIGDWFLRQNVAPDRALVSPARRTRETWALVAPRLGADIEVMFERSIYEARTSDLLGAVKATPAHVGVLVVVGHNPGLEDLTEQLTGGGDSDARRRVAQGFPPGAVVVLECPCEAWQDLQPATADLVQFVTPKDLGANGQ
jgi:phosphohistidine phosphatase